MSVDSGGGGGAAGSGFGARWGVSGPRGAVAGRRAERGRGRRRRGSGPRRRRRRGVGAEAGRAAGRSGGAAAPAFAVREPHPRFRVSSDVNPMEQPGEGPQPPQQQPWGRLLRLGAGEGEPHVLLRKPEWTIGRRRGADRGWWGRTGAGGRGPGETVPRAVGGPWAGPAVLSSFSCESCGLFTYRSARSLLSASCRLFNSHYNFMK